MKNNSILIQCECRTEAIEVEKIDEEIYLSFWIMTWYTGNVIQEIKERFKFAFNILFKGKYQYQEIVLNNDKTKKLINELERRI